MGICMSLFGVGLVNTLNGSCGREFSTYELLTRGGKQDTLSQRALMGSL